MLAQEPASRLLLLKPGETEAGNHKVVETVDLAIAVQEAGQVDAFPHSQGDRGQWRDDKILNANT